MDHLDSAPYVIGDCLDSCDSACDVGHSTAAEEKGGNREAMGRRRAQRLVMSARTFFLKSGILVRFLRGVWQLELAQRLVHTRSLPRSAPVEWATSIAPGTANSNAKSPSRVYLTALRAIRRGLEVSSRKPQYGRP